MGQPLEVHIRRLQEFYWSDADPDGRGFVPLADALRRAGDLREAHRLLRDGLNRHPDYLSGHVVAAWVSLDRGDAEEAESRFRTVLDMDPANVAALRGLADVLLEKGEVESAMGYLETLSGEDPVDLTLPERITELRVQVEAGEGRAIEVDDLELPIWDSLEEVAEELNWEGASLQPDAGGYDGQKEMDAVGPEPESRPDESSTPYEPGVEETPTQVDKPGEPFRPDLSGVETGVPTVVEDGEPIPAPDDLQGAVVTSTLGEIYLRQGLFDRAEEVFESLLKKAPDNERLRERLEETRSLMQSPGARAVDEVGLLPEEDGSEEAREVHSEASAEAGTVEDLDSDVVLIEALAPDRMTIPGSEEVVQREEPTLEEPISLEALAPDEPVSVDAFAPDEPVSVEALAPEEPISLEALAPDEPVSVDAFAPDEPVSVEALAPDEPISLEALAPDEPVSVDAFAPDEPVSVEALAPDDEEESVLDAFERWLENL